MLMLPKAMWLIVASALLWLARANFPMLTEEMLSYCGTESLALSPSNPCFFRVFSIAQVWNECETQMDGSSSNHTFGFCLSSCINGDLCKPLCASRGMDDVECEPRCHFTVQCLQEAATKQSGAVSAEHHVSEHCFKGHIAPPSSQHLQNLDEVLPASQASETSSSSQDASASSGVSRQASEEASSSENAGAMSSVSDVSTGPVSQAAGLVFQPTNIQSTEELEQNIPATSEPESIAPDVLGLAKQRGGTHPDFLASDPLAETLTQALDIPSFLQLSQTQSCMCSFSGTVNGTATGHAGCATSSGQRAESLGAEKICYVQAGSQCGTARASLHYTGLFVRRCVDPVDNYKMLFPATCSIFRPTATVATAHAEAAGFQKALEVADRWHNADTSAVGTVEDSPAVKELHGTANSIRQWTTSLSPHWLQQHHFAGGEHSDRSSLELPQALEAQSSSSQEDAATASIGSFLQRRLHR